jgi:hypothetical protein
LANFALDVYHFTFAYEFNFANESAVMDIHNRHFPVGSRPKDNGREGPWVQMARSHYIIDIDEDVRINLP